MRSTLILSSVAAACMIVWLLAARSLSMLIDRAHTTLLATLPVNRLRYDNGVVEMAGVRLDTLTTATMPSGLVAVLSVGGRVAFTYSGSTFPCGAGRSLGTPGGLLDLEFSPDPGDTVAFTSERSLLGWPTPFAMNFMTGSAPSWRRHLYCRLIWTKRSGARMDMLWRFEQGYFRTDGWRPQVIEFGTAGLSRVKITEASDLLNAAARYLARTHHWDRSEYRLEDRGPANDGNGEIIGAIHRDDERSPQPGGGRSVQLIVNYESRAVTREIAFQ